MKNFLLLFVSFLMSSVCLTAQNPPAACTELFISEYSQGNYNNRAMEIYNPTNATINLSQYYLGRNDNGGTTVYTTTFPTGATIAPYKTYVVITDKRDTTQYRVGLEYPIFDGYQKWDTCRDANNLPIIDPTTNKAKFCVQVDATNGNLPLRGTKYNDFLDLKCRGNGFINAVYATNRTMYFSGNDGMLLFKGTPDVATFTNLVDMVGVFNDPGMTVSTASWKDYRGYSVTEGVTLVRKREIRGGTGLVAYSRQDTFRYGDWLVFANSNASPSFQNMGSHTCNCDAAPPVSARRTCAGVIVTASQDVKPAVFHIYPNPSVSGNIRIEADGKIESLQVMDIMGRVVDSQKLDISGETVQLTVRNVNTGMYFVKIMTVDNRIGVQRLVIKN